MSTSYTRFNIQDLPSQDNPAGTDLLEVAVNTGNGYATKKESAAAIADAIVGEYQYPLRITGTTAKTIAGAINELKNLVDLLPQFAIEVVQILPVSDISETTIYLVPASDPEQGNYYEEYIYVNNAWELVGTTAVDLSQYYTKLEVDGLLATKANTADVSAALALKENAADMEEDVTDIVVDLTDTIETAEGNPITLQTVQEGYAKAVAIKLTPKQDLHGYDKPWPGGGGKNKLPYELGYMLVQTVQFSKAIYLGTGNYTINFESSTATSWRYYIVAYNSNGEILTTGTQLASGGISWRANQSGWLQGTNTTQKYLSFEIVEAAYFAFGLKDGTVTESDTFYHSQLEAGDTATAYEPYANICPIEGYEEVSATRTGVDGATATAEFPETIYGATGDIAGGEWDKEWGYIASYNGETLPAEWMSDRDEYEPNTTPTTGAEVAYELATPEPFQTAPAPLTLKKGNNTITTDGDSVKVKYNKLALPDIGGIGRYISALEARIEALEGASSSRSLSLSPTLTKSLTSELDTTEGKTEEETEEETKEEAQKNER